jgi:hypothetical protein
MRSGTRLDPHQAGLKIGKKVSNLRASKLAAENNSARRVNRVHLEHALPKIETDGSNLHGGRLLSMWCSSTTTSWHSDAVRQGPSTPSTPAAFTGLLDDGRICLTNNAAERALRGIALGRKAWLFAGSDRGGERAAAIYSLIGTAKLNGVDPQVWLADVLGRINDHPASRLDELLPWHWKRAAAQPAAA